MSYAFLSCIRALLCISRKTPIFDTNLNTNSMSHEKKKNYVNFLPSTKYGLFNFPDCDNSHFVKTFVLTLCILCTLFSWVYIIFWLDYANPHRLKPNSSLWVQSSRAFVNAYTHRWTKNNKLYNTFLQLYKHPITQSL